ncbi:MAG: 2TM domain-containing protein [Granulosicoccus sp.]
MNKISREEARDRVAQMRWFYLHLGIFGATMVLLLFINMMTTPGILWFLWALFGWGFGVLVHGAWVFRGQGLFGRDWEEKKIRELTGED